MDGAGLQSLRHLRQMAVRRRLWGRAAKRPAGTRAAGPLVAELILRAVQGDQRRSGRRSIRDPAIASDTRLEAAGLFRPGHAPM
jgi:hypothetical protein